MENIAQIFIILVVFGWVGYLLNRQSRRYEKSDSTDEKLDRIEKYLEDLKKNNLSGERAPELLRLSIQN